MRSVACSRGFAHVVISTQILFLAQYIKTVHGPINHTTLFVDAQHLVSTFGLGRKSAILSGFGLGEFEVLTLASGVEYIDCKFRQEIEGFAFQSFLVFVSSKNEVYFDRFAYFAVAVYFIQSPWAWAKNGSRMTDNESIAGCLS